MMKEVVWSDYQNAVFSEIKTGNGNCIILARAGSGKTKTLVQSIKLINDRSKKVLAVAFNKKIAVELNERIAKSYIEISTIHSLGLKTLRHHFGNIKITPDKVQIIVKELHPKLCYEDSFLLEKSINLAKNMLIDTPSKLDILIDDFGICPVELDRDTFISTLIKIMRIGKERKEFCDFSDMLWLTNVYALKSPTLFDFLFIDEVQDITKLQLQVALSACKPQCRIICFGDDLQTLYGFNGVPIDGVEQIKKKLSAKTLPLSISYRCPKKVIELAKEFASDITASDTAIDGKIINITAEQLIDYASEGDFVLSRSNAPLIKYCMLFLKHKIPSNIAGKDVGAGLLFLIKKSQKKTLESFKTWLDAWRISEIKRCMDKKRSTAWVTDKYECLTQLSEDAKSLSDVESNIKKLFQDIDDENKVVFSTVHQAKGLERENVFLLNWTFHPDKNQEEANIKYVAITRSKNRLYFVEKD